MARVHSHYSILDIATNADLPTIRKAANQMRERDKVGNYTIVLNNIEQILTDPDKREQYDDSIQLPQSERANYQEQRRLFLSERPRNNQAPAMDFLDVQESDARHYQELQRRQKQLSTQEEVNYDDDLHFPTVFPWKKIFLVFLLAALGAGGFYFGKPFYLEYKTYQEADQALNDLLAARDQVIQYIRTHKIFPDQLPNAPTASHYSIQLTENNIIKLTFSNAAQEKLRGSSFNLEPYEIPNMGLSWRCSIDSLFPEQYKPARCF